MNHNSNKTLVSFIVVIGLFLNLNAGAQTITTAAGTNLAGYSGNGGPATAAELNWPSAIAFDDSNNVYITEVGNNDVRKINFKTGIITTVAGNNIQGFSGDGGPATNAELHWPCGLILDDSDNIYIADQGNDRIRKVSAATGIITTFAGIGGTGYSGDGAQATAAEFYAPTDVAVDDSGNIYITDQSNNRIRKVTAATGIVTTIGGGGTSGLGDGGPATAAEIGGPYGIARDNSGNLYISDIGHSSIRKITASTGIITTIAGNGTYGFSGDGGPATLAEFATPEDLALDNSGNVYVPDIFNNRIRKITVSTGIISTVAGNGTPGFSGDGGAATAAEIYEPSGVGIDNTGTLYIADWSNNRARKVINCLSAFSITPPSPSVCNGQSVLLTAKGGTTYQWLGTVNTTDTITVSPLEDTTYEVVISNGACSATDSVKVTVIAAPPLIIVPPSPSVCAGQSIILSVPVSGSNYTWSPALTLSSSTGDSVSATPLTQTTYSVSGTDSLGCSAKGDDVVYISPTPTKPVITQNGNVLTSSATQGNQWVRNDSILQGATNQTYTVTLSGWYKVIAENPANGCSSTSDSFNITSGINQLTVESGRVTVYPNPTGGEVFVNMNSSITEVKDWNLQVTDVLGRTVLTMSPLNPLKGTFDIDLSNLSGGMYFISVINKTNRVVVPVVKE